VTGQEYAEVLDSVEVFVEVFDDVVVSVGATGIYIRFLICDSSRLADTRVAKKRNADTNRILLGYRQIHLAGLISSPGCPVLSQSKTRPHSVRQTSFPSSSVSFQMLIVSVGILTGGFEDSW